MSFSRRTGSGGETTPARPRGPPRRRGPARPQVAKGQTYHIKLAVADAGDSVYDSVVYVRAQSLAVCPAGLAFCGAACAACCEVSRPPPSRPPPHPQSHPLPNPNNPWGRLMPRILGWSALALGSSARPAGDRRPGRARHCQPPLFVGRDSDCALVLWTAPGPSAPGPSESGPSESGPYSHYVGMHVRACMRACVRALVLVLVWPAKHKLRRRRRNAAHVRRGGAPVRQLHRRVRRGAQVRCGSLSLPPSHSPSLSTRPSTSGGASVW